MELGKINLFLKNYYEALENFKALNKVQPPNNEALFYLGLI